MLSAALGLDDPSHDTNAMVANSLPYLFSSMNLDFEGAAISHNPNFMDNKTEIQVKEVVCWGPMDSGWQSQDLGLLIHGQHVLLLPNCLC